MKIAFIGIGNMGEPMAINLLKANHTIFVYDIVRKKINRVEKEGCVYKESIKLAVKDADCVITMLPEGKHVKEAYLNEDGIINHTNRGSFLIDCSTIDVKTTKEIGIIAKNRNLSIIDAPVSGGTFGAENASLTFMVGGRVKDFKFSKPILSKMGKKIIHMGELGAGQITKACNNMLLGISMIALGEVFTLADKLGLDQKKLFKVSSKGTGMSWAMLNHLPVADIIKTAAANNEFKAGFAANMILKDLSIALSLADSVNLKTPAGALAKSLFERFVEEGGGDLDYSAVIKLINGTNKSI